MIRSLLLIPPVGTDFRMKNIGTGLNAEIVGTDYHGKRIETSRIGEF